MAKKLSKDKLEDIVKLVFRSWEGIDEKYHKAEWQIIEMIKKPAVTHTYAIIPEEWIEEKAERFVLKCPGIIGWHSESVKKFAKDFICSLIEEIRKD